MAKVKDFKTIMEEKFGEFFENVFIEYGNEDEILTAISTGSLSLDARIGIGGIPRRRYTIIDGLEGIGKSTVAISIAKQTIKGGEKVLYIDVENQMTFNYLDSLLGEGHIGQDFILAKPDTSDDAFIIAETGIISKEFALIVLDSVGALASNEEKERKFEQDTMAIIPRDLGKFLRRNTHNLRINNIAFVFINQLRDKIGSYMKAYDSPGGHALKYFSSVTINLKPATAKELEITKGKEKIGAFVPFAIKKNKVGFPTGGGLIPIIPGVGIDSLRDVIEFAKMTGVLTMAGPFYKLEGEVIGKGYEDTLENIKNTPELLDKITKMCYTKGIVETEIEEEGEE